MYKPDTANYERGDPRISKQCVNVQADRVNEEHRMQNVERETVHEETQDE
jgi:hypothetical protein